MFKVLLVMHSRDEGYYRMNKVSFESMPVAGQYIYNSDGLAYQVEEVALFAGYVSEKGAIAVLVVHPLAKDTPVSKIYGLDIERDLDD
ncbi:hypothetical protein [Liquorilactobacillus satsumensis]|nr:hypothetical protein [Liquorilactobacillus satsumensis]MCC7667293.1 LysR family transcriptional regulator [Liquorilactobacillus satsumensis]MCP9327619.1 LysR family transcriptional regulator [Liquorilactobacillus satsumensis]MCP9357109.1 LysR family transcriptional regulator [Liquorilactobacillus satsumensis]MCP9371056.1 LysR family transcriptional regulator [Liquorilactobacillus satsumensis]